MHTKTEPPTNSQEPPLDGDGREISTGPIRLTGFRINYSSDEGTFGVKIDGVFNAGPLIFSLEGLGLDFGLGQPVRVLPRLSGAGLDIRQLPAFALAAGLVFLPPPRDGFAGMASIELQNLFSIRALGGWERLPNGTQSIFAYAELRVPEGLFTVPPVIFTGLALGLGVNSSLRHPSVDELQDFPLIGQTSTSAPPLRPIDALNQLMGLNGAVAWVTASAGRYWAAGGISFTVFKFIETAAVIVIEVAPSERAWKALLAGRTVLDLPRSENGKTMSKVAIDFAIGYDSFLERFSADAQVGKGSFVLDPKAKLYGGLALRIWGKDAPGQERGFVLTLGGYHSAFSAPDHFPNPPRLELKWKVGPVSIRGRVYAALTDNMLMAGGLLEAEFDSGGNLRLQAWLRAQLDALLQWKPFYYDVQVGVRVGVAATVKVWFVKIRVQVEVGVQLSLYGPPLGGRAEVRLWFVTFTFPIGVSKESVPLIVWEDFAQQLPSPIQLTLQGGRMLAIHPTEAAALRNEGGPTLVTADTFRIAVITAVPNGTITINGIQQGQALGPVSIRPMRRSAVATTLTITITQGNVPIALSGWRLTPEQRGVSNALWGDLNGGGLNDPPQRTDRYTYLEIRAPESKQGSSLAEISVQILGLTDLAEGRLPHLARTATGPTPRTDNGSPQKIFSALGNNTIRNQRTALHDVFAGAGFVLPNNSTLAKYAWIARSIYTTAPMLSAAN
ncbi:MAG TPA: DUF6603 domain-containing protein [Nitrosospira sp.]|nr:DUF6603 domain-containing protein [Nitrosospira sp.]